MLIQCILKREGGTQVQMEEVVYHFKPTPRDPRHLAEVLIQAHAERFLAISEGYRMADGQMLAKKVEEPENLEGRLFLSTAHASQFELADGSMVSLFELTEHAYRESAMTLYEWNNQEDESLYEALDQALKELNEGALAELAKSPSIRPTPVVVEEEEEEDEEAQRRREQEDEEQERKEQEELARVLALQKAEREAEEAEKLRLERESENSDEDEEGDKTGEGEGSTDTPASTATDSNTTAPGAGAGTGTAPDEDPEVDPSAAAYAAERAELSVRYEKLMGRKPNHRMANERIRAVLDQEAE